MDAYTPTDMASQLADGVAVVLPWVGAAVAAALVLFFAFKGIRAGIAFFQDVAELRRTRGDAGFAEWQMHFENGKYQGFSDTEAGDYADYMRDNPGGSEYHDYEANSY